MPSLASRSLAFVLRGFTAGYCAATAQGHALSCSALKKLAAQSRHGLQRSTDVLGLDVWQCELLFALGVGDVTAARYPSGPLTWLGATGEALSGTWLHADPVRLLMTSQGLALHRCGALTKTDLENMGARLQTHLASLQMAWHVAQTRAFIRSEKILAVDASTVAQARQRGMHATMPQGPQANELKRLMTELQMLLHEQPTAAANASEAAVNAIWLWGAGTIKTLQVNAAPSLWTNNDYARGIYRSFNLDTPAAAASIDELPVDVSQILDSAARDMLIVADVQNIEACDSRWFAPLLDALNRKRIQRCSLFLDGWQLHITPSSWRRWLSRAKPLNQLLESPE